MANFQVIEFLLAGFTDNSGEPLSGGKIYTYIAGTNTAKATYTDVTGLSAETNPIQLDSNGRKQVFAATDESYKFVIKTSADVTLYTYDNLFFGNNATSLPDATSRSSAITYGQVQDGTPPYVASVAGAVNALTLAPSVPITAYVAGQLFRFKVLTANTAATTVNVNSLGAKNLKVLFNGAKRDLIANDLLVGDYYDIFYDGTDFILLSPRNPIIDRVSTTTTVSNTAAETSIYSKSIPANTIAPFRTLKLRISGDYSNTTGVATGVTFRVKFGGTTIATYVYTPATSNSISTGINRATWVIEQHIDGVGASSQYAHGHCILPNFTSDAGGSAALDAFYHTVSGHTSLTANSANANTLEVTAQLSSASASLTLRSFSGFLEVI